MKREVGNLKGHVYKPSCKCPKDQRCKCGAKWAFLVDVGINPANGKRKQKFKGGFKTKKEAEIAKDLFMSDIHQTGFINPSKMLFSDLAEEWMGKDYSTREEIKPATIRIRKHEVDKLNGELGFIRAKDISLKVYQAALDSLKAKGFSDSTMSGVHGTGRMIFRYAMKMEYLKKDPTTYARVLRKKRTVSDVENRVDIPKYMEKEELQLFLDTALAQGLDRDYATFFAIAYSGLRVGEWCALNWAGCDFEKNTISITKTLYNPTNHGLKYELVTPKTKRSIRKIKMDPEVMEELRSLRIRQKEFKLRTPGYFDGGFVSALMAGREHAGHPENIKMVELRMSRLLKLSGLNPDYTPHTLRHTHASLLAEGGATLESIQDRLGHGDDEITRLIYLHVTDPLKKEAAQRFSDLMSGLR